MNKELQIRHVFSDEIPGVKQGVYYIAEKHGGVKWEAADTLAGAIANYEADKRQQPVKTCHSMGMGAAVATDK